MSYLGFSSGSSSQDEMNELLDQNRRSSRMSVLILVLIIVAYVIYSLVSGGEQKPTSTGRIELSQELCGLTEFTFGESDYSSSANLVNAMTEFYSRSGVQPVLYDLTGEASLTDSEIQKFADDFYANGLFVNEEVNAVYDEGHFLLVFQADGTGYRTGIHIGKDAAAVIDDDAEATFMKLLDEYYSSSSTSDILPNTYNKAASEIMGKRSSSTFIFIAIVVIIAGYAAATLFRHFRKGSKTAGSGQSQ